MSIRGDIPLSAVPAGPNRPSPVPSVRTARFRRAYRGPAARTPANSPTPSAGRPRRVERSVGLRKLLHAPTRTPECATAGVPRCVRARTLVRDGRVSRRGPVRPRGDRRRDRTLGGGRPRGGDLVPTAGGRGVRRPVPRTRRRRDGRPRTDRPRRARGGVRRGDRLPGVVPDRRTERDAERPVAGTRTGRADGVRTRRRGRNGLPGRALRRRRGGPLAGDTGDRRAGRGSGDAPRDGRRGADGEPSVASIAVTAPVTPFASTPGRDRLRAELLDIRARTERTVVRVRRTRRRRGGDAGRPGRRGRRPRTRPVDRSRRPEAPARADGSRPRRSRRPVMSAGSADVPPRISARCSQWRFDRTNGSSGVRFSTHGNQLRTLCTSTAYLDREGSV